MNNRLNDETNVAGIAYCNLEEYACYLVFKQNIPYNITRPYITSAETMLDNTNISDEVCAEQIESLTHELESQVSEYIACE